MVRSALGLLLAAVGCEAPDRPLALSGLIPPDVVAHLRPDSARARQLHPGVVHRYLWSPHGPWAVHLVSVDLARRCELALDVLRAGARETGGKGREAVSSMAARSTRPVFVAVNGDFFTPEGDVRGIEVVAGRTLALAARPAFAWRPGGDPWMGTPEVGGDSLHLGWALALESGDDGTIALGGRPDLIDAGRHVGDLGVEALPGFAAARHPRTAVGYDASRGRLWIVVVDGRRPSYSNGMTLPELAALFEALGATEALNLDGGGSTTMVVIDSVVNRPSDVTGERPVANALAVVGAPEACRSSSLSFPR